MPPKNRYRSTEHRDDPGSSTAEVPATVWAPPPAAVGQAWRPWVVDAIMRAFLPPRGRWTDLSHQLGHDPRTGPAAHAPKDQAPARLEHEGSSPDNYAPGRDPRHGVRAVPFWAALIGDMHPAHGPEQITTAARSTTSPAPNLVTPDTGEVGGGHLVDLVLVDLGDAHVDDRLGVLAARALRSGGILAVLTGCRRISHSPVASGAGSGDAPIGYDSELADPTGLVVASAQNADLLYLQHIVIPTRPLTAPLRPADLTHDVALQLVQPSRDVPNGQPQHGNPVRRWRGHAVAHADLLVFARSGYAHREMPDGPPVRRTGGVR